MKNMIGGILGAVLASIVIVTLLALEQPPYDQPYDSIWMILLGSDILAATPSEALQIQSTVLYLGTWVLAGVISGLVSDSKWNTVRTAVWIGGSIAIGAVASKLLLDPLFWGSASRNVELFLIFTSSILSSLLTLISSVPLIILLERIRRGVDLPPPDKIETRCECGAVFRSKPILCSECGRKLGIEEEV
ncbi:MAG: hypothetical protein ACFE7R_05665 [Candidatus Hodarchaeota archaeon]